MKKKPRSDKKHRVNCSLDQDTFKKLKRLAIACDEKPTPLANDLIKIILNSPEWVNFIQDKYEAGEFRIIPIKDQGKTIYSEYLGED